VADAIAAEDVCDIGEGGGVGSSGAGADGGQVVADDVREDEGEDGGGRGEAGELAAFDGGQVLADGVHFVECWRWRRAVGG
jgi:hypothetical protein